MTLRKLVIICSLSIFTLSLEKWIFKFSGVWFSFFPSGFVCWHNDCRALGKVTFSLVYIIGCLPNIRVRAFWLKFSLCDTEACTGRPGKSFEAPDICIFPWQHLLLRISHAATRKCCWLTSLIRYVKEIWCSLARRLIFLKTIFTCTLWFIFAYFLF